MLKVAYSRNDFQNGHRIRFSSFFPLISALSLNNFKLLILRAEIRGKKEEKSDAMAILKIISRISYL